MQEKDSRICDCDHSTSCCNGAVGVAMSAHHYVKLF